MTAQQWTERVSLPLTVGLMVGCIALSLETLFQRLIPAWHGTYITLFCSITAFEALWTYRLYRHDRPLLSALLPLQALEVSTLCVVRQLGGNLIAGHALLHGGVPWLDSRGAGFFALNSGLVAASWLVATAVGRDLERLRERPWPTGPPVFPERRLVGWFLAGGVLLFVVAGLTQARVAEALRLPDGSRSGPTFNVLLYVVLGLLLLGQVKYLRLQRRQSNREIAIVSGFERGWASFTAAFLAVVIALVLLLPTNRSGLVVDAGQRAWVGVISLLGHGHASPRDAWVRPLPSYGPLRSSYEGSPTPPHPPGARPSAPTNPFAFIARGARAIKALLLWLIVVGSLWYRLRRASLSPPRPRGAPVSLSALLRGAGRLWSALLEGLRGCARSMRAQLGIRPHLRALPALPRLGRPRPPKQGPRTARDQIFRYYWDVVRLAERRGFPRRRSQTPHQYVTTLAPNVGEAEADLRLLTDAFVEVRYSAHPVEATQVNEARTSRRRVRWALRRTRRCGDEEQAADT